jgi:hypothetical protein
VSIPESGGPTCAGKWPLLHECTRYSQKWALVAAYTHNCDIVLANDPDADRLQLAERDRYVGVHMIFVRQAQECSSADGGWRVYSGNEMGVYTGHQRAATICAFAD